jgi:transposase
MKPYSEDLRRKVVGVIERGLNKSEVAHLFGVNLPSVKRYAKMAREGRPLAPRKAPGKRPRSTSAASGSWKTTSRSVQQRPSPRDTSS